MNPKIRALLWEELRVGGVIAGAFLALGLIPLISIYLHSGRGGMAWQDTCTLGVGLSLFIPLFAGTLLTLTTSNTGDLKGGFSPRILLLPVDTWQTVAVSLVTRTLLVAALAAALFGLCRVFFDHGPGVRGAILVAEIYLLIQTLEWARRPAPIPVLLIVTVALGAAAITLPVGGDPDWSVTKAASSSFSSVFALVLVGGAAYGISLAATRATRHGQRVGRAVAFRFPDAVSIPLRTADKPFASPMAAQVWFELRTSALFLPLMAAGAWLLGVAGLWLIDVVEQYPMGDHFALTTTHAFEILPFVAVVFGTILWAGVYGGAGLRRRSREDVFRYLQPMTAADMAKARLIAAGAALVVTLTVAAAVSSCALLFGHGGIAGRLLLEAIRHGETTVREVLALFLGIPLIVGLVCWGCTGRSQGQSWVYIIGVLGLEMVIALGNAWGDQTARMLLLPFTLLVAVTAGLLFWAYWRGLLAMRHVLKCVLAWAAVTLAFYPFSMDLPEGGFVCGALVCSVALGALTVLPYVALVCALARRRHGGDGVQDGSQHAARGSATRMTPRRMAAWVAVSLAVLFIGWLRWPAEPAYKALWHAKGYPTNAEEVAAWYPSVPPEKNLALKYLAAGGVYRRRVAARTERLRRMDDAVDKDGSEIPAGEYVDYQVLICGNAELDRTEAIPPEVWHYTSEYWEEVARDIAPLLHEAAESGLTESRYPVDLTSWYDLDLRHLSSLRSHARTLYLEAFIAAVERRPHEAAEAILAMPAIADSLSQEPVLISQLVRVAVLEMTAGAIEDCMNRGSFSAADMVRLGDMLVHALPPVEEQRIMDRALIAEHAQLLSFSWGFVPDLFREPGESMPFNAFAAPLWDVAAFDRFQRCVVTRGLTVHLDEAARVAKEGLAPSTAAEEGGSDYEQVLDQLLLRAPLAALFLPSLSGIHDAEWRVRARLELVQAALAVERYRLAKGRLPESLDELVPVIFPSLPRDPGNGWRPVSYRAKDNGEFVVYSYGRNREDDGGVEAERETSAWFKGDLTFTVAPPEMRDRPQVGSRGD